MHIAMCAYKQALTMKAHIKALHFGYPEKILRYTTLLTSLVLTTRVSSKIKTTQLCGIFSFKALHEYVSEARRMFYPASHLLAQVELTKQRIKCAENWLGKVAQCQHFPWPSRNQLLYSSVVAKQQGCLQKSVVERLGNGCAGDCHQVWIHYDPQST